MHSVVISLIAVLLSLLASASMNIPAAVQIWLLALSVGGIGVPHGGLDHWVGRALFYPIARERWLPFFLFLYMAVAVGVVVGWFVAPLITILLFFLLSAWHFGIEESVDDENSPLSRVLENVAVGGMVIWIPVLFQRSEVEAIVTGLVPEEMSDQALRACELTAMSAWILAPVVILSAVMSIRSEPLKAMRLAAFAFLFATNGPLISFMIYFCGWHSIRGLVQLRKSHAGTMSQFLVSLLPLTLGAIALAVPVYILSWRSDYGWQNLLRTTFIGLSAIAIPHLLLHVIASAVRTRRVNGVYVQTLELTP